MIGDVLANRYTIKSVLGEGAMGLVWLVEDTTTGQDVALKVISRRIGTTEKSILEFMQEFRLMTQLRHQHCCEVRDYGLLPGEIPYMTMEVVPGHGLDERLPFDSETFTRVFSQLLLALGYIHQRGFVHCDLKPANVRVQPDGTVKLMDYGLMEFAGRAGGPIKGTVSYMAPEMVKRGLIDQRADLYSAGVLAYEMLTGQVPFQASKPGDVLRAHLTDRPVVPSRQVPGIDPVHEKIVLRLLAKDPIERYQSAEDVLEDLGIAVAGGLASTLLTSPLMGRAQEMAKLFVHLARIVTGKAGGVIWLTGPSGIGKSRLVKEFSFNVQLENLPYAVGGNHEFAHSPYGPFVAVLRGLLPAFKESIPEAFEKAAPILVKLLPEIGGASAPDLEPPSNEKLRLQATLTELLLALARARGAVLLLEDWQWADPLSREYLDHLTRNMGDAPLLIMVTARSGPEAVPSPKPGEAKVVTMALAPLAESGLRRMVVSMLGTREVDEPLMASLIEFSGGNPYHVEMLLEHLVSSGLLIKQRGQWVSEGELTAQSLSLDLKGLLLKKIAALPEEAQRLARIAAVFGYGFEIDRLRRVAEVSDEELFAGLALLAQQQILMQDEAGTYGFAQDQIQDLVYMSLSMSDKLRLHTTVGLVLEEAIGELPVVDIPLDALTAIADQFLRAARPDKTIVYALEAGLRHATLYADREAEHYLEGGLARLTDQDDPTVKPYLLQYLRCLGDVRHRGGRLELARDAYLEALALAEEFGDRFLISRLLSALSRVYQGLDSLGAALSCGERALALALESDDAAGAARCLLTNCRTRFYLGEQGQAITDLTRAMAFAREADDKACLGETLAYMGYMYVASDSGKLSEGVACLNESVALLSDLGDKHGLINAYSMLGLAQGKLGDFQSAQASFGVGLKLAREVGNHLEATSALVSLATNALELGDFKDARALAREGADAALHVQSTYQMGISVVVEAAAHAHLGQFSEALALLHVALDLGSELNHKYMETRMLQFRSDLMLLMGNLEDARATAERMQVLMRQTGNLEPQGRYYQLLGELMGRQGDHDGAREYLKAALSIAGLGLARGQEAQVLKTQAWLALKEADPERAKKLATEAFGMARSLGAKYLLAELEGLLGEIALATGSSDAADHFARMAELASTGGYEVLLAEALFGQAASAPYAPEAADLAVRAQAGMAAVRDPLSPEAQAWFQAYPERMRVFEGNYIAFSLPLASAKAAAPAATLNKGMWNLMDR